MNNTDESPAGWLQSCRLSGLDVSSSSVFLLPLSHCRLEGRRTASSQRQTVLNEERWSPKTAEGWFCNVPSSHFPSQPLLNSPRRINKATPVASFPGLSRLKPVAAKSYRWVTASRCIQSGTRWHPAQWKSHQFLQHYVPLSWQTASDRANNLLAWWGKQFWKC